MSSPPSGPRRKLFSASTAEQQREPVLPIGSVEDVPPPTRTDPGQVESAIDGENSFSSVYQIEWSSSHAFMSAGVVSKRYER
ncbi:hypothetical protein OUZ56_023375 [Daphnia magna]|uniref:Uncharacterized protein n=1 Tax=Daphnia magna TaxID=35525 RepID=A0ABR0AZ49_9CRUS|nr:hypothetical protein OUZ56_023375 [Daphnia magna]